eukprot:1575372-Rhodomonas_salina.1
MVRVRIKEDNMQGLNSITNYQNMMHFLEHVFSRLRENPAFFSSLTVSSTASRQYPGYPVLCYERTRTHGLTDSRFSLTVPGYPVVCSSPLRGEELLSTYKNKV